MISLMALSIMLTLTMRALSTTETTTPTAVTSGTTAVTQISYTNATIWTETTGWTTVWTTSYMVGSSAPNVAVAAYTKLGVKHVPFLVDAVNQIRGFSTGVLGMPDLLWWVPIAVIVVAYLALQRK